jgi:hypothetical protein
VGARLQACAHSLHFGTTERPAPALWVRGVLHMKRLMMSILMCAIAVAAATPAFAQSKDFAGSWVLDADKSGSKDGPPMIVVTMNDKEFTARMGSESARLMTFKLDGTETTLAEGVKTKAAWNGNKLAATVVSDRGPETITISRDGAWLVMEGSHPEHGPMKLYFKKAPAK